MNHALIFYSENALASSNAAPTAWPGNQLPLAVKVSGDPQPGNNGIFYTYSDHLGSTSVMSYGYNLNGSPHPDAGAPVPGSEARYLPFGGYRSGGSNPITDRGYTGHKHNDSLGLIYMNARYYSPYLNRFLSADSIVPDPTNPQQYNRYTYTLNNPLRYKDPSGHCIVQYSGDVRMNEGPYGTSGLCPNTESVIQEGHSAMDEYHALY